jgi:hypothetical protein
MFLSQILDSVVGPQNTIELIRRLSDCGWCITPLAPLVIKKQDGESSVTYSADNNTMYLKGWGF